MTTSNTRTFDRVTKCGNYLASDNDDIMIRVDGEEIVFSLIESYAEYGVNIWKITMGNYYTTTDWYFSRKLFSSYESMDYTLRTYGTHFKLKEKTLIIKLPSLDKEFTLNFDQRIIEKSADTIFERIEMLEEKIERLERLMKYNLSIEHYVEDINYVLTDTGETHIKFSDRNIEISFSGLSQIAF